MTMLYLKPCYNKMCYKGPALNVPKSPILTLGRRQSKTSILSTNVDKIVRYRVFH